MIYKILFTIFVLLPLWSYSQNSLPNNQIDKVIGSTVIEFIALIVGFLGCVVSVVALFYSKLANSTAKKALTAELLKSRFEMYFDAHQPVSNDLLSNFRDQYIDWMDSSLYERAYKSDDTKARRYIKLARIYEYLAMKHELQEFNLVPDPNITGTELWIKNLWLEDIFKDVHAQFSDYYPKFKEYIDKLEKR